MSETAAIQWMLDQVETIAPALRISDRVYPDKAPKGAGNPCLIFQVLGAAQPDITDSGPVTSGTLDIQLRYYAGQRFIATSGRETLRQFFQNAEAADSGGIRIEGTSFAHGGDTFEEKTEDYGAIAVLAIHWTTAASN